MNKKILVLILFCLMIFTNIIYAQEYTDELDVAAKISSVKAKVLDVKEEKLYDEGNPSDEENNIYNEKQIVTLEILGGDKKGEIVTVENYIGGNEISDIRVKKGQRVVLAIDDYGDGNTNIYIDSYERDRGIYILIFIFILSILLVGKFQGVKTIITLTITVVIVYVFTIPMILQAFNPILISVISCIAITVITLFIISGINEKSFAAIIGTALSVIISGVLSYIIGYYTKLSGIEMTEGNMLLHIPQNIDFNFKELLFAGIIIGTLGAAMDMCMSVTSSMHEVKKHNPDISTKELFKSGLNVGKDVMGTMTNTLILAYTGSALPILLVFVAYETPLIEILNLDIIATEIVRSIAGSIGVVLSVPITAYIVTLFEIIKNKKISSNK